MIHKIGLGLATALLVGLAMWVNQSNQPVKSSSVMVKLDQIVRVSSEPALDCGQIAAQQPIVILALGQSNAGNHGELAGTTQAPVMLFADGKCIMATDPLPGSTGNGGSIWSHLPRYLPDLKEPLVLSVIGVDATSIADWTFDKSLLLRRLNEHIKAMKVVGLLPQVIIWQQGEADARLGTTSDMYAAGLDKLAETLTQAGSDAPIIMALSTVCRSLPDNVIRTAITDKAVQNSRFKVGPDTDTLTDAAWRVDGCHFSSIGLDHAAQLWASELRLMAHLW